jgi:hypothetical protein
MNDPDQEGKGHYERVLPTYRQESGGGGTGTVTQYRIRLCVEEEHDAKLV